MKAPDFAEPLHGWRAWRVAETRHGVRLWSVIYDEIWEPRQPLRATCRGSGEVHDAPEPSCECGIYASRSSLTAARYLIGRNDPLIVHRVVGLVALWGLVLEGAAGWRAEFAYPKRMWVPDAPGASEIARLLRIYGAAVVSIGTCGVADVAAELVT